eukprot:scaffold3685_cov102-Isochrysis_galbana.AAC.6
MHCNCSAGCAVAAAVGSGSAVGGPGREAHSLAGSRVCAVAAFRMASTANKEQPARQLRLQYGLRLLSSPMVVLCPCPAITTVSVGSVISFCWMDRTIMFGSDVPCSDGMPAHDVRPIEPRKRVSPVQQKPACSK